MSNPERDIWDDIEAEYITTDISLRELADKHNVSYGTLRNKSMERGWSDRRKQYREDKIRKILETQKDEAQEVRDTIDALSERVCLLAARKSAVEMTEYHQGKKPMSQAEVSGHLHIIAKAQEVLYRRLGVPPPKTTIALTDEAAFGEYQKRLAIEMGIFIREGAIGVKIIEGGGDRDGDERLALGDGNGESTEGKYVELKLKPPEFDDEPEPENPNEGDESDEG